MRCLAELRCQQCGDEFYGDLPAGQGLYTPMLLERRTGVVHDVYGVAWFAAWLQQSYAERTSAPLGMTVWKATPGGGRDRELGRKAVLLNCLDTLYGHTLLKLLNAQYYIDERPDLETIVMVPRFLEWMVPDGVAQRWVVDLPLSDGTQWNDWLAGEVRRLVEGFDECYLSLAFSHPSACDYSIERFTGIHPFPRDEWEARLPRPAVTFIWRDDRRWDAPVVPLPGESNRRARWADRLRRSPLTGRAKQEQWRRVLTLAEELRRSWPAVDLAVAGLGTPGGLPSWIMDLRCERIDTAIERRWCERYAASHIVVGVHGSNMLLPSAHAGAVVELMPPDRWGNVLQDLLVPCDDARETMFRRRILPASTSPQEVALVVDSMLRLDHGMRLMMSREFCRHGAPRDVGRWQFPPRSRPHS